jgi:hypothetical protein
VELAWAKLLGAVLLLAPVPVRLKEWATDWCLLESRTNATDTIAVGLRPLRDVLVVRLQASEVRVEAIDVDAFEEATIVYSSRVSVSRSKRVICC